MFKQSTLEDDQGENKSQDLKQAPIHKKEGRTTRRCHQEREVITPASLDDYLARVFMACQLHLATKSNDARRKGERKLILQNVVPHLLIASNGRWRQW